MKTHIRYLFVLRAVAAGFSLMLIGRISAQTCSNLYQYTATHPELVGTNGDGANPKAGLILSGNSLFGTASGGGSSGRGTVFKLNTDGTGFATLHCFTGSDGADPSAGLILSGNTLYGTASKGGSSHRGTVFKLNTDGTGFTTLHEFTTLQPKLTGTNTDGANPEAGLILSGDTLYGTARFGGSAGWGTVFKLNTDGTGFMVLHSFASSDGADPSGGLTLSGRTLYGTVEFGGQGGSGVGAVFAVNTDGTGFMVLHAFSGGDGTSPFGGVILLGNVLYGTTASGGSAGKGTLFKLNTDGAGFTTLHHFTGSDGTDLVGGLILSGNTLYGTAIYGGNADAGTVFAVNLDGSNFTTLYRFASGRDGTHPESRLILSGSTLFGTARFGGSSGDGAVFSLSSGQSTR